jgi:rare lipoprotein A
LKTLKIIRFLYQARFLALLSALLLSACASSPFVHKDGAPTVSVDPSTVRDAIPRHDEVTRAGNKNPYTVLGKTYHLLPTAQGYREEGVASWYGTKFHGRPTANGEPYSLYGMTAAHTTLPIPSYVKVTNLANKRTAIVRINDRGPFHENRIIDLSYAAAVKLGYAEKGIANVLVEVIDTRPPTAVVVNSAIKSVSPSGSSSAATSATARAQEQADRYFLQVGAFKNIDSANNLRARLALVTQKTVSIKSSEPAGFYRVHLGPLVTMADVLAISEQLLALDIEPRLITE